MTTLSHPPPKSNSLSLQVVLDRLEGVKRSGDGYIARCPAHQDNSPSLSATEGNDGRILLHCHAGCTLDAICLGVGIKPADLFPQREAKPEIVAAYDYHDELGALLYQVVRLQPKDFRQRRPDSASVGGWNWSTKGVRRVLYRLPDVLKAVADGTEVYICEGEKDVAAVVKAGFCATCNAGGAGKWLPDYSGALREAKVVIIADKDKPGREHAAKVAASLQGIAASVKAIELPDIGGRAVKDAADFFAAGGGGAELVDLVDAAPEWTPDAAPELELDGEWFSLVRDAADIVTEKLPAVVEIAEGIVAEQSKLIIGSGSKSYKTWLTMHLGICISHGLLFLGRKTSRRVVLYVNLELKPVTFSRRVQVVSGALGVNFDRSTFLHLPLRGKLAGLSVAQIIDRIISTARKFKASVVIIDPVYKLNTEGDENSSRDQTILFNQLDRVTTEAECTLILNDHFGKGNQSEKDPLDAIRGSSAKGGDIDAAMILRRHETEDCFRVDMIHRELAPVPAFCIGWKYPLMEVRDDLNADAMKKPKGGRMRAHDPNKILAAIGSTTAQTPISVSAWAHAAGITRQTLQGYLSGFRSKGLIATAGEGSSARQYITAKGKALVNE